MRKEYKNFIKIGESVHASIPSMGKLMREVFDDTNEKATALAAIEAKVIERAEKGASYIDVNVDDFFAENAERAAEMMRVFVKLVADSGCGVPACIDSSNDELVIEGLRAWYSADASASLRPMVNSIKPGNMEALFPIAKDMPYVFIALMYLKQDLHRGVRAVAGCEGHSRQIAFALACDLRIRKVHWAFDSVVRSGQI